MKLLVVLSGLLACAFSQVLYYSHPYSHIAPYSPLAPFAHAYSYAPAPIAAPIVTPVASQYRAQDELGQFTFATAGDNQARVETGLLDGSVRGAYSYVDPAGKLVNVQYLADDNGFRVLGANNLPEAPAGNPLKGPEPVKDTPEVEAARAEFAKKFAEAAAAAKAAPEEPAPLARRKRQVLLAPPLPIAKATVSVQQLEPVDAKVPASTQKAEIRTSEKEVALPLAYAPAPYVASPYVANPYAYSVAAPYAYSVAPQVVAAPVLTKATVKVQQYEPVDDAKVPASTRKLELKEREHEVVAPVAYSHLPYYNYPVFG